MDQIALRCFDNGQIVLCITGLNKAAWFRD